MAQAMVSGKTEKVAQVEKVARVATMTELAKSSEELKEPSAKQSEQSTQSTQATQSNKLPLRQNPADKLLALIAKGLQEHATQSTASQLGDRSQYIGMSDIAPVRIGGRNIHGLQCFARYSP